MKARRQRADSTTAAVATAAAAARDLSPPRYLKLRQGDRPFWNAVIAERARSEWSDADLAVAAQLARAMADAERLGSMSAGPGGHVDVALLLASAKATDALARRVALLRRTLGIHSRGKHGEQRDVDRRRVHLRGNEAALDDDDGLLARPPTFN